MTKKVKALAWIGIISLLVISFLGGVIVSEKGFISITKPPTTPETMPTTTPEANRTNPAFFGNPVTYENREVTVLGVEKIEQIIESWSGEPIIHRYMPNGGGYYLIITLQIKNIGPPDNVSYYSTREFKVVGSKGKIYPPGDPLEGDRDLKFVGGNELFEGEFYGGYTKIGRILRPVDADDSDLLLRWEPEKGIFRYLSLNEPVTPSPVPYTGTEVEYPGSPTNVTLPTIPFNQSLIPPSMYYPYNLFPISGASDVPLDTYISVSFTRPPGILKLEIEPEAEISHVKKELILYSGRYTFYLAEPLQPGTNYTVTITAGQKEPPGPGFAPTLTTSWEFTTTNTGIASRDRTEANGVSSSKPLIVVNSTVFEGERWMSILSDGKVIGYSAHYYPSYKEIVIKEGYISREEIDAFLELCSNLSEYSEYTVNASGQLIRDHMDCIFDPIGGGTIISCLSLNKTLKLEVRPPSFPEPETATPTAKEIVGRIDKIFRETGVVERVKEINP
jgi:hypothetical protein